MVDISTIVVLKIQAPRAQCMNRCDIDSFECIERSNLTAIRFNNRYLFSLGGPRLDIIIVIIIMIIII